MYGTHRIREHPELEGTRKDHWVQLLSPHRNTQKSDHSRTTHLYSNKALLFYLQMPDIDLEGLQQCYFPLQVIFFIPSLLSAVVIALQVKSAFPFNVQRVHILLFLSGAALRQELDLVGPFPTWDILWLWFYGIFSSSISSGGTRRCIYVKGLWMPERSFIAIWGWQKSVCRLRLATEHKRFRWENERTTQALVVQW